MIILCHFIHPPCYRSDPHLLVQIIKTRVIDNIVDSELNLLLLLLIVRKNKCLYKLRVKLVWYHFSSTDLDPLWSLLSFVVISIFLWPFCRFLLLFFRVKYALCTFWWFLQLFVSLTFLLNVIALKNGNNWISGAKSFHKRQIFTSNRQLNIDCVFFVFDGKCNVWNFNDIYVIMLLICVFISLLILRGWLDGWMVFLFLFCNQSLLHAEITTKNCQWNKPNIY